MDGKARDNESPGIEYRIDREAFESIEDDITAYLTLWIHGRITYPVEDLSTKEFYLSSFISESIDLLKAALSRIEDIESISSRHGFSTDADNLLSDINSASRGAVSDIDEVVGSLKECEEFVVPISERIKDYKYAFDELITEHHPDIIRAVKKAKLMQSLSE